MEGKPSRPEAPRPARISRRRALAFTLAPLGAAAFSAIDSKFGVAPPPAAEAAATPATPTPPKIESAAASPATPTPAAEAPQKEFVIPKPEVLSGKDREAELDRLDAFLHEFFKPEAIEELRNKGWVNDGGMVVEELKQDGVTSVMFKNKENGQTVGAFVNDPKGGVRKEMVVNTDSEEPNLKVFLRDVKPRLINEGLEFNKISISDEEVEETPKEDFQTLGDARSLPEDEAIDPVEDSKIIRLFARLPLEHKLYREGSNNYIKHGEIAVIPGNAIELITVLEKVSGSSDDQVI